VIRGVRDGQQGVLTALLLEARALRQRPLLGLATTLALVLLGLLARLPLDTYGPEAPFLTFWPAVVLGPLLGGVQGGVLAVVLSGLLGWYLDLHPEEGSFGQSLPIALALFAYTLVAVFIVSFVRIIDIQLDRLAQERELYEELFKDLQHRVANNLQILSSLLQSQEKDAEPSARAALRQARLRLSTVANLNRRLYDPRNQDVPVGEVLRRLCDDIVASADASPIECRVEAGADIRLSTKPLLALSLIVNELVTNALKHAFPKAAAGTIVVGLALDGDQLLLTVKDDGVGVSDEAPTGAGLGMRIVEGLTSQLGGALERGVGTAGAEFRMRFPK